MTVTNVLLFLLAFHVITSVVACILIQVSEATTRGLDKSYERHEKGGRIAVRAIVTIFIFIMCMLLLPVPYLIITLYFKGVFDDKELLDKADEESN